MTRFFLTAEQMQGDFLVLTDENAAHAKVLRLKAGEQVLVCDGSGNECLCTISDVSPNQISLVVNNRQESSTEAKVKASIYMAFSKGDKLEHVIQKATELGAYEIVAFPSNRCVSRPDETSIAKKLERWQKIAEGAAKQSGRGVIPTVGGVLSFKELLNKIEGTVLFCYEGEDTRTIKAVLQNEKIGDTVSVIIGSEGGFSQKEADQLKEKGAISVGLGKRILRCETAPVFALSCISYELEL